MGIDRSDLTRIAYLEAERHMMTPATRRGPATAGYGPDLVPAR